MQMFLCIVLIIAYPRVLNAKNPFLFPEHINLTEGHVFTESNRISKSALMMLTLVEEMKHTTLVLLSDDVKFFRSVTQGLNSPVVILDDVANLMQSWHLDEVRSSDLLLVHFKKLTDSIMDILRYSEEQGSQRNILFIVDEDKDKVIEIVESVIVYQVFVAISTKNGYQILEKCAYCNQG